MTITRGAIAPGKRQTNWRIRLDIIEWLDLEARRQGLLSIPAAANFWLSRIRTGAVYLRERSRRTSASYEKKATNWRIWQTNYDWLDSEARTRELDGVAGAANFWLARCMNGEVFVQE